MTGSENAGLRDPSPVAFCVDNSKPSPTDQIPDKEIFIPVFGEIPNADDSIKFCHEILEKVDENYGKLEKVDEKIILEHTSANPNGPLHIGHVRNIARIPFT